VLSGKEELSFNSFILTNSFHFSVIALQQNMLKIQEHLSSGL